ncbi:MAG: glucosamine 6-phosphate synthetase [Bacteroidetes bacterium]|nr:glucosamine 6-phosphate synthetase [Bacteroidota bacterium]
MLKATGVASEILPINDNVYFTFGHTRLVTNGSQLLDVNNQPVIKNGIVGVHNGIIVNDNEIWNQNPDLERQFEIDTEVLISLLNKKLDAGEPISHALRDVEKAVVGTLSIALLFDDKNEFLVYSNYGSFYVLTDYKTLFILASEKNILNRLKKRFTVLSNEDVFSLKQITPLTGYLINVRDFQVNHFDLNSNDYFSLTESNQKLEIAIKNIHSEKDQIDAVVDPEKFRMNPVFEKERDLLEFNFDRISKLKRCTKCILPETFPFIHFDEQGVCNYCKNYKIKNQPKPMEELFKLVEPYRKKDGIPDVLIPFSGGRDSTLTLHLVKKELGLNPIAFTYDWGMVTDLARRNIARACGQLGVEHIIVSADIKWKRNNIRKNILAWMKKPHLGMIPLFMAGDKYFFYYCDKVRKQNDILLNIWGINPLENTDFKVGYAGLAPEFDKKMIYSISLKNQLNLFKFVGSNFLLNTGYLNSSLIDTFGSFASRYFARRTDYFHMFDYYRWDEDQLEQLLHNEYGWEKAIDTPTTWRIGDGTASFYNYVYYTVGGFSEYDTFRSNQVREGMITRERALELVNIENRPRYETLKWYLEIVGLDFEPVVKVVNSIPKNY